MHADLDAVDRTLLDLVQAGVPLVPRPFARLAQALGADEAEVLTRLRRLAEARVLRQIGAIFDTRACGYASALVAARVAPEALPAGHPLAAVDGELRVLAPATAAPRRSPAWASFWPVARRLVHQSVSLGAASNAGMSKIH